MDEFINDINKIVERCAGLIPTNKKMLGRVKRFQVSRVTPQSVISIMRGTVRIPLPI